MKNILSALTKTIGCGGASYEGVNIRLFDVGQIGVNRLATSSEITAAQTSLDADAANDATLQNLKNQAIAAINTLKAIQNATNPTNASVIQAVKDLALIQERVIRVVFQALT